MGNCSSCLGGDRYRSQFSEEDEAERLFDDLDGMHYGSFDQAHVDWDEDPIEVQRETDALQRVVARTSENMIDIYEIVPLDKPMIEPTPRFSYNPQVRLVQYQALLSKLSIQDHASGMARVDWGLPEEVREDEETIEMQQSAAASVPVKIGSGGEGVFVGDFDDAAAAMH